MIYWQLKTSFPRHAEITGGRFVLGISPSQMGSEENFSISDLTKRFAIDRKVIKLTLDPPTKLSTCMDARLNDRCFVLFSVICIEHRLLSHLSRVSANFVAYESFYFYLVLLSRVMRNKMSIGPQTFARQINLIDVRLRARLKNANIFTVINKMAINKQPRFHSNSKRIPRQINSRYIRWGKKSSIDDAII